MISNDMLRGSVRTIILQILKENGPMHGYAITRKVEELTSGKIKLTYGAIYPVLHKLEEEKVLITTSENYNNRIRVQYSLTEKGNSMVAEKIREMVEFIESIQKIIELKPGLNHART